MNAVGAPGWFGKLPGMGDFASRRLPEDFRSAWDRWLQFGLLDLRANHNDWTERYLQAPLWCFVLGRGAVDERFWLGAMMPSVDAVGRYFPLTVAVELDDGWVALRGDALAQAERWWTLSARAMVDALEHDLDAERFERLLQQLFERAAFMPPPTVDAAAALAMPGLGQSLWFTDPAGTGSDGDSVGQGMMCQGLPLEDRFEALFGYGDSGALPGDAP